MLQEYFKLNKNILIAFAVSITFSAIIAQSLSEQEDYLNTTYTLIFDYVFYFTTFELWVRVRVTYRFVSDYIPGAPP